MDALTLIIIIWILGFGLNYFGYKKFKRMKQKERIRFLLKMKRSEKSKSSKSGIDFENYNSGASLTL